MAIKIVHEEAHGQSAREATVDPNSLREESSTAPDGPLIRRSYESTGDAVNSVNDGSIDASVRLRHRS